MKYNLQKGKFIFSRCYVSLGFDKLIQLCDSDSNQDMQHFHHPSRSLHVPLVILIFFEKATSVSFRGIDWGLFLDTAFGIGSQI